MRNWVLAAGFALGCWLVAAPVPVQAQESEKVFRLGSLSPAGNPVLDGAFTEALRRLGYVEGKNLIVEQRQADNQLERLPALAAELVDRKVDVILATGTLAPLVLKKVTTTIPVVIWSTGDPVGSGIVSSLARPGGNTTGLTIDSPELAAKRLQLLKEIIPGLARVAVIWNAANPYAAVVLKETQQAGSALAVRIESIEVRSPLDFDNAFAAVIKGSPGGLVVVEDPLPRGRAHDAGAEPLPVHAPLSGEGGHVDGAQGAGLVGQERLLAAGVDRLDGAEVGRGVVGLDAVEEQQPGLARLPGGGGDAVEQLGGRKLPHRGPAARVAERELLAAGRGS